MRYTPVPLRALFLALGAMTAFAACSHANYAPVVVASASPAASASASASASSSASPQATASASATSAPAVCNTPAANAAEVAMGSYIEPSVSATYGTLYGYSLVDSSGNYSLSAAPIVVAPGQPVQFVNVDPVDANGSGTTHSAVGLQQDGFPPSYTFPAAAQQPTNTTFSSTALWSTGLVTAGVSTLCYSQTFTAPSTGTYSFGDFQFYNSVNERDVVVVRSST